MKINQLKAFIAVVEARSILQGAKALGVTQPAVSAMIRDMEKGLGVKLLVRGVSGIEVTEFGELLLRRARAMISDLASLNDEIAYLKSGGTGVVAIALSSTIARVYLPPALNRFRQLMPDAQLRISETSLEAALEGVRDGTYAFAFTQTPPEFACPPDLERLAYVQLPLVVGARATHPLARVKSLKKLADAEWLLPLANEHFPSNAITSVFLQHGATVPRRIIRCQSIGVALGLFESLDLVGLFARPLAELEFERFGLTRIDIPETFPAIEAVLIHRGKHPQGVAASCLIDCFTSALTASGQHGGNVHAKNSSATKVHRR